MQDLMLKLGGAGVYDLEIDGADFASVDGFETAITVSLFTDARAPAAMVPQAERRRGWIGNIFTADVGRELGGLLWVYEQARLNRDTLNGIQTEARRALNWMLEDGVARQVDVAAVQNDARTVTITVRITGQDNAVSEYAALWLATNFNRMGV